MILVAAALDANPTAAINAPIIVTTLHPKRFVKELAMGPAPSVTPTNIDGIKDTEARLVPSNPLINATTNIPKEYVIPSAMICIIQEANTTTHPQPPSGGVGSSLLEQDWPERESSSL